MTIKELYNACEKAIDSGKTDIYANVLAEQEDWGYLRVTGTRIDKDGDFIIKVNEEL